MNVITNLFQLSGGVILSIGYIPQIIKMIKTKSVSDFSFKFLLAVLVGISFMEVYAIYNFVFDIAIMFFITNTVSLLLSLTMVILYVKYSR